MRLPVLPLVVLASAFLAGVAPASAAPPASPSVVDSQQAIPVAEGCGWGRWRGPWGGCRGPGWGPSDYYGPPPGAWQGGNGCPPGYWRGPWGHCRDTPYHGRLPGGGWK
jgi:hypothetical protein